MSYMSSRILSFWTRHHVVGAWRAHTCKLDAYMYSPGMHQQHATGGSWPENYVERGFVA